MDRLAWLAALLVAGLAVAVSIRSGTFTVLATDPSSYVSAGGLWQNGDIFRPDPIPLWARWPGADHTSLPVGYRIGAERGTEVSFYPFGFPLLIALAVSLGGPYAAFMVAPVLAGVLVWCAFVLGRLLAGSAAGLLAGVFVATSPIVIYHAVHPMSDVPAAAFWLAAWSMAVRGTASAGLAAGAAACMAILVRPNLVPMAAVMAIALLVTASAGVRRWEDWRWRPSLVFVVAAACGPLLVVWSQAALYGNPLAPGYPGWEVFFKWDHVPRNLRLYPELLMMTHTLLPLAGLVVAGAAVFHWPSRWRRAPRVVAVTAAAVLVVNIALYLPYLPYDQWPFLRFLLPGLVALFVLFAAAVVHATRWLLPRARPAVLVPIAAVVIVIGQGREYVHYAVNDWRAQARIGIMGHYLREALPPNAAVLSFIHSGGIAHYTGREIVRLDLIAPDMLDRVVDDLVRHAYRPVFVLDDAAEQAAFRERFQSSRFGRLDWPARAVFATNTSISYFDAADFDRPAHESRWPIDVLRQPPRSALAHPHGDTR